jgi:hypothetical protein
MILHAAAESATGTVPGTYAVALSAPNEESLLQLESKLLWERIPHSAFREPDPPYNGALMAIGINPVEDRRIVRRFLKGFPLVGREPWTGKKTGND